MKDNEIHALFADLRGQLALIHEEMHLMSKKLWDDNPKPEQPIAWLCVKDTEDHKRGDVVVTSKWSIECDRRFWRPLYLRDVAMVHYPSPFGSVLHESVEAAIKAGAKPIFQEAISRILAETEEKPKPETKPFHLEPRAGKFTDREVLERLRAEFDHLFPKCGEAGTYVQCIANRLGEAGLDFGSQGFGIPEWFKKHPMPPKTVEKRWYLKRRICHPGGEIPAGSMGRRTAADGTYCFVADNGASQESYQEEYMLRHPDWFEFR